MQVMAGVERHYEWGSPTAIPRLLGRAPDGTPVAELWFGAHHSAPSKLLASDGSAPVGSHPLNVEDLIVADPEGVLGEDVASRFGSRLPFLLKIIAPARALSLQVHPHLRRARQRFAEEEADGIPLDSPLRNYRDTNHKPEMVFALTDFQAMCGFRAPRRAAELMRGLNTGLSDILYRKLRAQPNPQGVEDAFASLLTLVSRPAPDAVVAVAEACARRLANGSPSIRVDQTVVRLHEQYPGDPGVVASMLLNPVTLKAGEAMFVPAGSVHAYLSGLAVEVMANSDNVLRAGLTAKPIDVPEMLTAVDYLAAPPVRIAPEHISAATAVFYAPVDDFELGVTSVTPEMGEIALPGRSARIVLGIQGDVTIRSGSTSATLTPGTAVLIRADDQRPHVSGRGTVVQADVP